MTEPLTRAQARRRIGRDGIGAALNPAGFVSVGTARWVRRESELQHIIVLGSRLGSYAMEWGVTCPAASEIIWAEEAKADDVGTSLMRGWSGSFLRPPSCPGFVLKDLNDPEEVDDVVRALAADARGVQERLGEFKTRRDLWTYLMANRDDTDRRGFTIPAKLPLKLVVSAALAAIDRDPAACALLAEAEQSLRRHDDEVAEGRRRRLLAAVAGMCD